MTRLALAALAGLLAGLALGLLLAAPADPPPPAEDPALRYVAAERREPFHLPGCEWARRIAPANRRFFATREEAISAGHRPCQLCRP